MATLSKQVPAAGGSQSFPSLSAAASGGDQYINSGKEMLVVNNASGGDITVTFTQQRSCNQGFASTTHDIAVTVSDANEEWIPPVNPVYYNDDDGYVQVTYSGVSSVTVGVVSPT